MSSSLQKEPQEANQTLVNPSKDTSNAIASINPIPSLKRVAAETNEAIARCPPSKKLKKSTELPSEPDIQSTRSNTKILEDHFLSIQQLETELKEMQQRINTLQTDLGVKEEELKSSRRMLDSERAKVLSLRKSLEIEGEKRCRAESLEKKIRGEIISPFLVPSLLDAFIAFAGVESTREGAKQGSS